MAGYFQIERIKRESDKSCGFCSHREREGKPNLVYFNVTYAPSNNANRTGISICEECAHRVGMVLQTAGGNPDLYK